jgi:hypothetical protein
MPKEGERSRHQGTGEPIEFRNGQWQPLDYDTKMIEYQPGQYRTTDVEDYDDCRFEDPYDVFCDLISRKFIDLNVERGEARQLRDYKTGRKLETPLLIRPVRKKRKKKRGKYDYLRVKVWGGPETIRRVCVRLHVLVWSIVNGPVPDWKEIHHMSGNTADNGITNLEALTRQEHVKVGKATGAHKQAERGISRDDPVVAEIKQLRADRVSVVKMEEQTGLSRETCRQIANDTYKYREPTDDPADLPCDQVKSCGDVAGEDPVSPEQESLVMAEPDSDDDEIEVSEGSIREAALKAKRRESERREEERREAALESDRRELRRRLLAEAEQARSGTFFQAMQSGHAQEKLPQLRDAVLEELRENWDGRWAFDVKESADGDWSRFMIAVAQRVGGSEEELKDFRIRKQFQFYLVMARRAVP